MSTSPPIDRIPPIRCGMCGRPCTANDTWMWVDQRTALDAVALERARDAVTADEFGADWFARIISAIDDPGARWGFGHSECGPNHGAIYDVKLPGTYRGLLRLLAELWETKWLAGTDITAVLAEVADQTGRFAPTHSA